jgi:PAS domain S-box-containing protein
MISSDIFEHELDEILKPQTLDERMIEELSISDENGIIFCTDPAEEKMFGRTPDELISQQLIRQNTCSPEESARIRKEISEKLRIKGDWEGEFVNRRRDGTLLTKFARITSFEYGRKRYWIRIQGDITGKGARDISEQKRAEAAQGYLAAIVESSSDAIIGKTLQGSITSWNKGAKRLFGYTASEIIGLSINTLIPPDRQEEELEILERLRRGEWIEDFETVRVRKDGTLVEVSLTISPIRDSSGRIIGASKVARDISDHKRADAEREELLMREKAANRSKDEFISLVSHELRSPLNSILIYSQMLRSSPNDIEQVRQTCEIIERNARTQLRLVEDLLDIDRIVRGKLRLDERPTDIVPVLADALDVVRPMAGAKGIELHAHYGEMSEIVNGDSVRLQQVICNLLSNAIKFTPEGGRVELWLERSSADLCIVISDTGAGIDPAILPYIFDRFRQADSSGSQRHGGLGLGLALAKHLVELHGGTIEAASEGLGLGSTFTIRLPLAAQNEFMVMEPPVLQNGDVIQLPRTVTIEGVRVLAVDDQQEALAALAGFLSKYGATVTTVSSGGEALSILADQPNGERSDVLICDIAMPDEDGYTVMKRVRALEAGRRVKMSRRIPAIALTAMASREDWVRALSAGFNMHIAKPVEPAELVMLIASLVRKQSEGQCSINSTANRSGKM